MDKLEDPSKYKTTPEQTAQLERLGWRRHGSNDIIDMWLYAGKGRSWLYAWSNGGWTFWEYQGTPNDYDRIQIESWDEMLPRLVAHRLENN